MDLMALAFLGAWVLGSRRNPVGGGGTVSGTRIGGPVGVGAGVATVVAGGLLGAAFVAPLMAFPWLVLPAVAVAWASGVRGSGVAGLILAASLNCALVTGLSARGFRISPNGFFLGDLRASELLADVPLHDVWTVDLGGDTPPTLVELGEALRGGSILQTTPAVAGLGALRGAMGWALGWEDPRWIDEDASFLHRTTEGDRKRSIAEPGRRFGIWRVLYAWDREGVVETMNGTVHAAVAASLGEGPNGPRLLLAFWVREVNWTTGIYMRMIDPARRFFVYPALLRQLAHTWQREHGPAQPNARKHTRTGETP